MDHHHTPSSISNAVVVTALEEFHARQQQLARGDVAPRRHVHRQPTRGDNDGEAAVRRSPSPARAIGPRSRLTGEPRRREVVWITKPLQRWRVDGSVVDQMGTLEFLRGATLADVRVLVDQFYPLPHKRAYTFYYPTLRVPIDQSDESNVDPTEFDVLALVPIVTQVISALDSHPGQEDVGSVVSQPRQQQQPMLYPTTHVSKEPKPSTSLTQRVVVRNALPTSVPPVADQLKTSVHASEPLTAAAALDAEVILKRETLVQSLAVEAHGHDRRLVTAPEHSRKPIYENITESKSHIALDITATAPENVDRRTIDAAGVAETQEREHVLNGLTGKPVQMLDRISSSPLQQTRTATCNLDERVSSASVTKAKATPRNEELLKGDQYRSLKLPANVPDAPIDAITVSTTVMSDVCPTTKEQKARKRERADRVHETERLSAPKGDARLPDNQHTVDKSQAPPPRTAQLHAALSSTTLRSQSTEKLSLAQSSRSKAIDFESTHDTVVMSTRSFEDAMPPDISATSEKTPPSITHDDEVQCACEENSIKTTAHSVSVAIAPNNEISFTEPVDGLTRPQECAASIERLPVQHASQAYVTVVLDYILEQYEVAVKADAAWTTKSPQTGKNATTNLETSSPVTRNTNHVSVLISRAQFRAAFLHYGIDHAIMALNGALLVIESELSAWSNGQWELAHKALSSYLQRLLSQVGSVETSTNQSHRSLRMFETALNFVADVFAWDRVTCVRLEVIETSTDASFEAVADIVGKRTFRLSDNERSLLSRILSSLATDTATDLERWLADALEVLYFLLFKYLVALDGRKQQIMNSREQRVKWVIQKMVTMEASEWRRMELFMFSAVDDFSSWATIRDRLDSFRRGRHNHAKLLESDVFLRAFVTFVTNKAAQVSSSLVDLMGVVEFSSANSMLQRYVALMKRELEVQSWYSSSLDLFLRDLGLKVCDLERINKERQSNRMDRLVFSGQLSIYTHHQAHLLGSVYGLHKRPRWDLPDMSPPPADNRYVFHGDASIALEYVYVRYSLDPRSVGERWEYTVGFVEKEAASAFRFLSSSPMSKKANVACAVGLNALHVGWLREALDFSSLKTVVCSHPLVSSMSIGYHLSRNEDISAVRIVFRVHTDVCSPSHVATTRSFDPTAHVVSSLDRFICSSSDRSRQAFVSHGGLRFLAHCLGEYRDQLRKTIPYGEQFGAKISLGGVGVLFPRGEILFFIQSLLHVIPRSEATITSFNVALVEELAKLQGSQGDENVVEAAVLTLVSLSRQAQGTESVQELAYQDIPIRGVQKTFLAVDGLRRIKGVIDALPAGSRHRFQLEDALFGVLATSTICSQDGFLVHVSDWVKYFVETKAWSRSRAHSRLLQSVLDQIHTSFFVLPYVERDQAYCGCGCRGRAPAPFSALGSVVEFFCSLMITEPGRDWALEQMRGPIDLLSFVDQAETQSAASDDGISRVTHSVCMALLQIFTGPPMDAVACWNACCKATPAVLNLLRRQPSATVRAALAQVIGVLLDRALQLTLWKPMPMRFFNFVVMLVVWIAESNHDSLLSKSVARTILFQEDVDDSSETAPSSVLALLHQEHVATCAGDGSRSSILQCIVLLLQLPLQSARKHHIWRPPLLIAVCRALSDLRIARVLAELGIETLLNELATNEDPVEECILAGRSLTVFYLQARHWPSWQSQSKTQHTALSSMLAKGARYSTKNSFTRRQVNVHSGNTGEPLFEGNLADAVSVVAWYSSLSSQATENASDESSLFVDTSVRAFWEGHEWREYAPLERLMTQLKLLVVVSSISQLIMPLHIQADVAQILQHLVKFIRDRAHVPEHQVLLTVISMGNITTALGVGVQHAGLAAFLDTKFVERLLIYSRRPSPFLSHVASRALWSLSVAFRDRDLVFKSLRSPLNVFDEDQTATQSATSTGVATGIDILVTNITTKLMAHSPVEGDAATLALLLECDDSSVQLFFQRYRFSTVTKFISDFRPVLAHSPRSTGDRRRRPRAQGSTHALTYDVCVSMSDRDMIQLGRLAQLVLTVMARDERGKNGRSSRHQTAITNHFELPFKLKDELVGDEYPPYRSSSILVPFLDDQHPLVRLVAVQSVLIHLRNQPSCSTELLGAKHFDQLVTSGLNCRSFNPLQAASLATVRLALGDPVSHHEPFNLNEKLFGCKHQLVQCLQSDAFDVTKQAVELLVSLLSKNDDPRQRSEFATVFQIPENQAALTHAFALLCDGSRDQHDTASVLQRLVGFIIQLDLVKLIESDSMVDAMCLGLGSHGNETFVLAMICNCLCEIAMQEGKSAYFATTSRLNAIVSLLKRSLTNGEARNIGKTLRVLAAENSGIHEYLSRAESGCVAGIARVLGCFSRALDRNSSSAAGSRTVDASVFDDIAGNESYTPPSSVLSDERHVIRISVESQVFISVFTDDVYEEFLVLLSLLLAPFDSAEERFGCTCSLKASGCHACDPCDTFARAHGPRFVARFLLARRVLVGLDDTNQRMIEAAGSEAISIISLAVRSLQTLSRNHRCRVDMLQGSTSRSGGWWSVLWFIEHSKPSTVEQVGVVAEVSIHALMILSHICAESGVVDFVLEQREFVISIFTHLSSIRHDAQFFRCQRAASFLIARLAEYPRVARDLLVREKVGQLLSTMPQFEDRIVRANLLVMTRNLGRQLPDDALLGYLLSALQFETAMPHEESSVAQPVCDVLAHLVLIQSTSHRQSTRRDHVQDGAVSREFPSPQLKKSIEVASTTAWRSLFATFDDEDDAAGYEIVIEEARYASVYLWPAEDPNESLESLLLFLLHHHLQREKLAVEPPGDKTEDMMGLPSSRAACALSHVPSLQYVSSTAEQNARQKPDSTFAGSVHLWRFVQLLWRRCAQERIVQKAPIQQLPLDRIVATLGQWTQGSASDTLSLASLERRQRLLSFVNELLRASPEMCQRIGMQDIVPMLLVFASRSGSVGMGFELLVLMCQSDPVNEKRFVEQLSESSPESAPGTPSVADQRDVLASTAWVSPSVRVLWSAARPGYYNRTVPTARVVRKADSTGPAVHVLEPFVSSPATAAAMALLDQVSTDQQHVLVGFLQCQSVFVLLELLLLTLDASDSATKSRHTLTASLLKLLRQCVRLEPNTIRFFIADPRLLFAVQRQAFAVKLSTQLAAIELLLTVTSSDAALAHRLRRLEDGASAASPIQPWMVDAMEDQLTRLHLATLGRKEVVEMAHLVQVPLFAGVKTMELARLSIAFMESRLPEEDAFMVLSGDGRCNTPPAWMRVESQRDIQSNRCFPGDGDFTPTVESRKDHGVPVLLYKMQKDWYLGGSATQARSSIAKEIAAHAARRDSPHDHPTWLMSRCCRFLVEERAELLRRVSFVKSIPHSDVALQLSGRWNDTLSLLADLPILDGVSRDSLACLAFAIVEPALLPVSNLETEREWCLLLIHSAEVQYKVHLGTIGGQDRATTTGTLKRGDLFGLPWCDRLDERRSQVRVEIRLDPPLVLVSQLREDVLRNELTSSEFELVRSRCKSATVNNCVEQTNLDAWFRSLASHATPSQRRQLQLGSLGLLAKLVDQSVEYARAVATTQRVVTILFHVARGFLDRSLVNAAMEILTALVDKSRLLGLLPPPQQVNSDTVNHSKLVSTSVDAWVEIASSLIEDAVTHRQVLRSPLMLLLTVLQTCDVLQTKYHASKVFAGLDAAFLLCLSGFDPPCVEILLRLLRLLIDDAPTTMIASCLRFPWHQYVARLLSSAAKSPSTTNVSSLVQPLVVFFDNDSTCHEQMNVDIVAPAAVSFARRLIADVYVRSKAVQVGVDIIQCLEFMQVFSAHVAHHGTICDTAAAHVHVELLLVSTRVILDAFGRLSGHSQLVFRVVTSLCDAVPECAALASTSCIRVGQRGVAFHRHVFSVFQRHSSSPFSHRSFPTLVETVLPVVACIRALSQISRAAVHFVRHGFVELAFRYLLWRPSDTLVDTHAALCTQLLRALQQITLRCTQLLSTSLLHSNGVHLREFHSRLVRLDRNQLLIGENASPCRDAVAAFLDLLSGLLQKSIDAGDALDAVSWVGDNVAYQCFTWLRDCSINEDGAHVSSHLRLRQQQQLRFPIACLDCLVVICSSPSLTATKLTSLEFASTLQRLCDRLAASTSNHVLFDGLIRYLCALVEHLVAQKKTWSEVGLLSVLMTQVLPVAKHAIDQSIIDASVARSQTVEFALRFAWLVLFSWRTHALAFDPAIHEIATTLLSTVAMLSSDRVSERAVLNMEGLLSATVRLVIDCERDQCFQLRETIVALTFQLLESCRASLSFDPTRATPHSQLASYQLEWDAFSCRQWGRGGVESVSVRYGIQSLMVAVLRHIVADPAMQQLWLTRDENLHTLSSVALPVALHLLRLRQSSSAFVLAVFKKSIVFLRHVVSLAVQRSLPTIDRMWRRALRQAGLLKTVEWLFRIAVDPPQEVKIEILRLLCVVVTGSVVEATELYRYYRMSSVNVFDDVIQMALSTPLDVPTLVVCLELVAAAAATVREPAQLVVAAMSNNTSAFADAVIGHITGLDQDAETQVLTALFRGCHVVSQLVPLVGGDRLALLAMRRLVVDADNANDDNNRSVSWIDQATRLVHGLLSSGAATTEDLQRLAPPGAHFWRRMGSLLDAQQPTSTIECAAALCGRLLCCSRVGSTVSTDDAVSQAFQAMLLKGLVLPTSLGASLVKQWLGQRVLVTWRPFVQLLSGQFATIASLPRIRQVNLLRVLPAIVGVLQREKRLSLMSERNWISIRDLVVAWTSGSESNDSELQLCALSAVRCLLRAKQLRVLHDAAQSLRKLCRIWFTRYVALSPRRVARATRQETEVALGIQVLIDVSRALGFNLDQDVLCTRVVSFWLENGVHTEPRQRHDRGSTAISLVASQCIDGLEQANPSLERIAGNECARILNRILAGDITSSDDDAEAAYRILAALLRTPSVSAKMGELVQRRDFDVVDRIGWQTARSGSLKNHSSSSPSCDVLRLLCMDNTSVALRVQKRRILTNRILELEHAGYWDVHTFYSSDRQNRAFLALAAAVVRHDAVHVHVRRSVVEWKPLVRHCVACLQTELPVSGDNTIKWLALELLADLIQIHDDLLKHLWRICLLLSDRDGQDRAVAQSIALRALTAPLREATTHEDRRRAAFLTYGLVSSLRRAAPLVQARPCDSDDSLCDLLTHALFMSAGTRVRRTLRVFPTDWSSSACLFSLSLAFVAADTATWVLRVLQKCIRDKAFTRGLWCELDLFDQVFAALACSNTNVSSAAAEVLLGAMLLQSSTQPLLTQTPGRVGQRRYRQLSYFADIRAQESDVFTVAPRTIAAQALPSRFAVVELWIVFYSRRGPELQRSQDARDHLEAVQEVALYLATQCFSQIFPSDSDESDETNRLLSRAAHERHTALCVALLVLASSRGRETQRIRVLSVELLAAICASETTHYTADLFLDTTQLATLLQLIEISETETERVVFVQLLRELTQLAPIKLLLGSSMLLQQLVSWLVQPQYRVLQSASTSILKHVVTKSPITMSNTSSQARKAAAEQHHMMLANVAEALFVHENPCGGQEETVWVPADTGGRRRSRRVDSYTSNRVDHTATMCAAWTPDSSESNSASTTLGKNNATVSVIWHFHVIDQDGTRLRDFRHRGKLREGRLPLTLRHEIVLEPTARVVTCTAVLQRVPSSPNTTATAGASQTSTATAVQQLTLDLEATPAASHQAESCVRLNGIPPVRLTLHHHFRDRDSLPRGVLGRLLGDPRTPPQVVLDAVAIVTELSKTQAIFTHARVQLSHHVLAAMEASQRLRNRVDLAPLNALTSWFWSNRGSVANFRSSWKPLLALFQHLRSATFIQTTHDSWRPAPAEAAEELLSGPTFLTSLVEWIATLESDSLTENCLNVLFFENGDVLLELARLFYPHRSAATSFFFLVATAVRVNRLHCEVFARTHALEIMTKMLDCTTRTKTATTQTDHCESHAEMLQHAARVVAKIARAPTAADKFMRHNGMALFGKIAYAVFGEHSGAHFQTTRVAAENLVLASSFLGESAANCVQLAAQTPSQRELLTRLTCRPSPECPTLSLVETLLLFLARCDSGHRPTRSTSSPSSSRSKPVVPSSPGLSSSSFERLAAVVLCAWIEKWPSGGASFRKTLLETIDTEDDNEQSQRRLQDYARGMRRCIQLTRWNFYSDVNIVARTYSAAVSAGVRTGVIPLKCRNVFLPFDSDFLEAQREALQIETAAPHESTTATTASALFTPDIVQELRDVLRFVVDHTNLAQTLGENRKKTLTTRLQTAESGARIASATHAVLVVVYDMFVDALAAISDDHGATHDHSDALRVLLQWLTLLEQLGGLLCCSFHELDAMYYREIFQQMHTLLACELPAFLLKMERVQSRHESVDMVLNNLERLLRRLASKHELRGVTSLGASVEDHAEQYLALFAQSKDQVSAAIALALSGHDAVNRVHRGIIAAEYAWQRVLGASGESITSFMAGTKESESLWRKIRSYAGLFMAIVRHPGPMLMARWTKLQRLLQSLQHVLDFSTAAATRHADTDATTHGDHTSEVENDGPVDDARQRQPSLVSQLGLDASSSPVLVSSVPFTSLESLLDHYGFASTGVKKQMALLNFEELCPRVLCAFARALQCDATTIADMPAAKLERALAKLHAQSLVSTDTVGGATAPPVRALGVLLSDLQSIVDTADLGIHLRVILQQPVELSLWQLLAAPVQRARLFSVLQSIQSRIEHGHRTASQRGQHELKQPQEDVAIASMRSLPVVATLPLNAISESLSSGVLFIKSSVLEAIARSAFPHQRHQNPQHPPNQQQIFAIDRQKNRRIAITGDGPSAVDDPFALLFTDPVTKIVDIGQEDDPLSDEKLVASLKLKLRKRRQRQENDHFPGATRLLLWLLPSKWRYTVPVDGVAAPTKRNSLCFRAKRRVALMLLLLAFWRQEELESDLTNPVLARAFTSQAEREEFFVSTHLRKALGELVRVWMPESGSLGLSLWQWQAYGVGGTLLCVVLAWAGPFVVATASATTRNSVLTSLTYALLAIILLLSAKSMRSITKKHFVLQERNRLRLQPLGKYYQNAMAIVTVLVEVVQLNSITFDPQFNWNATDQLPKLVEWLGQVGISQIGIDQVELKAALCGVALGVWFILLKCANKFQESNPFLNRVVTKDLPGVLNGMLYMGLISTFFAFLSCVDCTGRYASKFDKCTLAAAASLPPPAPFLLSHQSVACWTNAHAPLAFLGFWGATFFLPIGLLSQGMSQVLFQQESLDIKYAPVVLLFSQLIKAVAATARAFFPFDATLLASVALAGNALLCLLMLRTKGASLWYLQFIKGGIYAASGWSAGYAIYRAQTAASTSVSNNVMYMGWLAIAALTAAALQIQAYRRDEHANRELLARQQRSQRAVAVANATTATAVARGNGPRSALFEREQAFVEAAATAIARPSRRTRAFLQQAAQFAAGDSEGDETTVPVAMRPLMRRARAFASGRHKGPFSVAEAAFMQNARKNAKKLDPLTATMGSVALPQPHTPQVPATATRDKYGKLE